MKMSDKWPEPWEFLKSKDKNYQTPAHRFFERMDARFHQYAENKHWDLKYKEGFLDGMDQFIHDFETYFVNNTPFPEDEKK
jgi:hypothetical protein